ncbi:MAG TPA: nucleotidyltransferase family protein [Trueperaceae bacterium]
MHRDLVNQVLQNPFVAEVVDAIPELTLANCFVAAGCIAQTVWNLSHGRDPAADIKDIDLVYFDPDLSESKEQADRQCVTRHFPGVPMKLDVKNEARVHLWYEQAFGYSIAPYASAEQAISTFPTTATAVAIRKSGDEYEVFAPFGIDDLTNLVVRANKRQITRKIYENKISRWREIWPRLKILDWDEA